MSRIRRQPGPIFLPTSRQHRLWHRDATRTNERIVLLGLRLLEPASGAMRVDMIASTADNSPTATRIPPEAHVAELRAALTYWGAATQAEIES